MFKIMGFTRQILFVVDVKVQSNHFDSYLGAIEHLTPWINYQQFSSGKK